MLHSKKPSAKSRYWLVSPSPKTAAANEGERVADHQWLAWEVEQAVEWSIGHVECKAAGVLNASLSTFIGLTV